MNKAPFSTIVSWHNGAIELIQRSSCLFESDWSELPEEPTSDDYIQCLYKLTKCLRVLSGLPFNILDQNKEFVKLELEVLCNYLLLCVWRKLPSDPGIVCQTLCHVLGQDICSNVSSDADTLLNQCVRVLNLYRDRLNLQCRRLVATMALYLSQIGQSSLVPKLLEGFWNQKQLDNALIKEMLLESGHRLDGETQLLKLLRYLYFDDSLHSQQPFELRFYLDFAQAVNQFKKGELKEALRTLQSYVNSKQVRSEHSVILLGFIAQISFLLDNHESAYHFLNEALLRGQSPFVQYLGLVFAKSTDNCRLELEFLDKFVNNHILVAENNWPLSIPLSLQTSFDSERFLLYAFRRSLELCRYDISSIVISQLNVLPNKQSKIMQLYPLLQFICHFYNNEQIEIEKFAQSHFERLNDETMKKKKKKKQSVAVGLVPFLVQIENERQRRNFDAARRWSERAVMFLMDMLPVSTESKDTVAERTPITSWLHRLYQLKAEIYLAQKKPTQALEANMAALQYAPDDVPLLYNCAFLELKTGQISNAVRSWLRNRSITIPSDLFQAEAMIQRKKQSFKNIISPQEKRFAQMDILCLRSAAETRRKILQK